MSNRIEFSTFPNSKVSALTILYLEKQDLSNLTPEDLADKYQEVYERINNRFREIRKSSSKSWFE